MNLKRRQVLSIVAVCSIAGGADWLWKPRTRPDRLTGIPKRDYQFRTSSPSKRMLSKSVMLLELPPSAAARANSEEELPHRRIKVFQMSDPQLTIDHCAISQVVLQVRDDGLCTLSLRAEQGVTPPEVEQPDAPLTATAVHVLQSSHIKRNQFQVEVRGFALDREPRPADENSLGKPVVMELDPLKFWVQRGKDYDGRFRECSPDAAQYFDLLDRVEVEFSYSTLQGEEF